MKYISTASIVKNDIYIIAIIMIMIMMMIMISVNINVIVIGYFYHQIMGLVGPLIRFIQAW